MSTKTRTRPNDFTTPDSPPTDVAHLIWFDPGITTGVCIVSIDWLWLEGGNRYSADPAGVKRALQHVTHLQHGRHQRPHFEEGMDAQVYAALDGLVTEHRAREMSCVAGGSEILEEWPWAAWGFESFEVRRINSDPEFLSPARIGHGLLQAELTLSEEARFRAPFEQSASIAKTSATDDRLKGAGLYAPGYRHANDAARHVYTFLRRARASAALRQQAWPHLFTAEAAA